MTRGGIGTIDPFLQVIVQQPDAVPAIFYTNMTSNKSKPASVYQTYWLVNGERIDDYFVMEQRVLATDAVAIEVSAERQQAEAERNQLLRRWASVERERLNRELMARQFEKSPEGQRAEALRTAAQHPGGIVSDGASNTNFADLDAFGRDNNPFKL